MHCSSATRRRLAVAFSAFALLALAAPARAINVVIDFSYDASNFFGAGNPSGTAKGAEARAAIQAVGAFYSGILADTFSDISKPPDFHSVAFPGNTVSWNWSLTFDNPATDVPVTIQNATIAADEYRVYVGARNLGSSTLGLGGPGGGTWGRNGASLSPQEFDQVLAIDAEFGNAVFNRGESGGFARWGGSIAFDSIGSLWHYNHNVTPAAGANDFYSVAIHEMAHALGFGASDEWTNLATGSHFAGSAAAGAYGGPPPLSPPNPTRAHWAAGTISRVFGTNTSQEAAMDPDVTVGSRKHFTALDAAALTDLGWTVTAPSFQAADFNKDRSVNAADLAVWKAAFPTTLAGNADGDGDTDGNDFLIWQRQLGQTSATAITAGVPEPTGAVLALWCVAPWELRRRRHLLANARA